MRNLELFSTPRPEDRAASLSPNALITNLSLFAGAGAGKTYNLISICLHLLGGARPDADPVKPSELWLLTFTEKAAAEMRHRLRHRLDVLARGSADAEPELRASFEALGKRWPRAEFWRKLRDELGQASIGTFHSTCLQLLRRAPVGAGVDAAFRLLDEPESRALLDDLAERLVLELLESGDSHVAELCRELGFSGTPGAVVPLVTGLLQRIREEGKRPSEVARASQEDATRAFLEALEATQRQVELARAELSREKLLRWGPFLIAIGSALSGMTIENFVDADRFPRLCGALDAEPHVAKNGNVLRDLKYRIVGSKDHGIVGLADAFAGARVVPYEATLVSILEKLRDRYERELDRRRVLDFGELLIRTRKLLSTQATFRAEVQRGIRALLVDEFQDTNHLQLEIVRLLAEKREGAPRQRRGAAGLPLPLEPAFLCAVGDRKQSIYDFRGADVSVFSELSAQIEREGGRKRFLQENWRSSPELIAFFNRFFSAAMAPVENGRNYEIAFEGGDALRAVRKSSLASASVEHLRYAAGESTRDDVFADAQLVAARVKRLLSDDAPERVERAGTLERIRGGDIALLFRRFTHVEVYRQALIARGVPHRVLHGRGFYASAEVRDLASLSLLIGDPRSNLSLAAVLRSPIVGVSDETLFAMARSADGRLTLDAARAFTPTASVEQQRLARFFAVYDALTKHRSVMRVAELLSFAMTELDLRAAYAGTPFAEQALANIEKVIALARKNEETGTLDCASFGRQLLQLAEAEATEGQADVVDAGDPHAVQILTIHQSKGLEWPVVFLPDLCARPQSPRARVLFDRDAGMAMRPWIPGDDCSRTSDAFTRVSQELSRRATAEHLRLLYVGMTRARDRLILSSNDKPPTSSWAGKVELILSHADFEPLVARPTAEEILGDALAAAHPNVVTAAPSPANDESGFIPVPAAPSATARAWVLPVTHLQEFARCPVRYRLTRELGLPEEPVALDGSWGKGLANDGDTEARSLGSVVHRVLEKADWAQLRGAARVDALAAALEAEGVGPGHPAFSLLADQLSAFFETAFARTVIETPASSVRRELPFLAKLSSAETRGELYLKGQIDLLLQRGEVWDLVDYKLSRRHPAGVEPYRFQLQAYALAALQMAPETVRAVRPGIVFLREAAPEPVFGEVLTRESLAPFHRELLETARRLAASAFGEPLPGLALQGCRELRCGYEGLCHSRDSQV